MFAARDQENLAFSHQHGAILKQQQGQASRQLAPKTPGGKFSKTPMKVPLNDENGANAMTAKTLKGGVKSNFMTPMTQRARAVLGDKTTNAKARGLQTVNVKSAVKEIEKSQAKPQSTVRQRQRDPQVETHKLQVHVEESGSSEDEIEYCPPRPKILPYESNVFPDGSLSFDPLTMGRVFKGYHRFYFNPLEETGASKRSRRLSGETRKVATVAERNVLKELDDLEWGVEAETGPGPGTKAAKKASDSTKLPVSRKPLSTIRSRNAADVLSMDDTTMSLQRRAAKTSQIGKPVHKKSSSFAVPALRTSRPGSAQLSSIPKKSATELDATSRTTIGYNQGRATASLLNRTSASSHIRKPSSSSTSTFTLTHRGKLPRSDTTLSNDSDKTITPAIYAHSQASTVAATAEDEVWRERVPFLSIFDPDKCSDEDEYGPPATEGEAPAFPHHESEDEFEIQLVH
ncbi:hypothetical protein GQX73_g10586 [Xylaria multiplex]|uniref:Uncharacterized protein n=1 Tax=Xylaria multiplex TaxID=323545 RepID=A0A7C8IL03_9PEZI|nr:hypothetical protein GQX73_g10586 [Xylaria multiplex]